MDNIISFQEKGFIQGIPLLSERQALKLRRHVEETEKQYQAEIEDKNLSHTPWLSLDHPLQRIFQSLAKHPVILKQVSQLIGPNILLRNGDIFIKNVGSILIIGWHVDTHFSWEQSAGMINCWIGLNPTSPFHGGLEYIPKSHKHSFKNEPPNKKRLSLSPEQLEELDLTTAVPNIMPAGHMAFHSFRTVHRSTANESEIRRIGLVLRFISAETSPKIAEAGQAFLVQGNPQKWKNRLLPYFPISWSIK